MRDKGSVAAAALILVALACTVLYATAQDNPPRPNLAEQPSGNAPPGNPRSPSLIVRTQREF